MGEAALTPPADSRGLGVFLFQELPLGDADAPALLLGALIVHTIAIAVRMWICTVEGPTENTTTSEPALASFTFTAASSTLGWPMIMLSTSIDEIHSPPDLMRSFVRSVIWM